MSKDKESNNFIPFNKPYFSGKEVKYILDGISIGDISGMENTQNFVIVFLKINIILRNAC